MPEALTNLVLGPQAGLSTSAERTLDSAWTRLREWVRDLDRRLRAVETDLALRMSVYSTAVAGVVPVGAIGVPRPIDRTGVLVELYARVGTPPVGSDLIVSWLLNGVEAGVVTIQDGLDRGLTILDPPVPVTQNDDTLQASVTQVGSGTPGSDLDHGEGPVTKGLKPPATKPSQVAPGGLITRLIESPGLGLLRTQGATPRGVPERAWVDGRNIRFTRLKTRVRKLDGYAQVDTTPDDEPVRLLWRHHDLEDVERLVRVGTARAWTGLAGDRVQIGSGLTGTAANVISADQYKDRLAWTDGNDPVMSWQPSGVVQPLGGLSGIRAKIIAVHKQHVVLFNLKDGGGAKPWRVMWSGVGTPDVYDSDTAGDLDLLESPGGITAAGVLGEALIVHKQHGLHRMTFIGASDAAYVQDPIPGHDGCVGPRAWVNLDLFQYYKGAENFYRLGAYPEKIGDPIMDEVRLRVDEDRDYLTIASYRPEWDEIHWRMASRGTTQPDFTVIYNVRDQTWQSAGVLPPSEVSVFEPLPTTYGAATAVEQHPNPGGSPTSPRFGDLTGRIYRHQGTSAAGLAFRAYVESTVFTAGLRPSRLLRVPVIATGEGTLTVRTRSWMDDRQPNGPSPSGPPGFSTGTAYPLTASTKPWVDVRGYGRRHQLRFESTGLADDWETEAYGLGELPGMGDR